MARYSYRSCCRYKRKWPAGSAGGHRGGLIRACGASCVHWHCRALGVRRVVINLAEDAGCRIRGSVVVSCSPIGWVRRIVYRETMSLPGSCKGRCELTIDEVGHIDQGDEGKAGAPVRDGENVVSAHGSLGHLIAAIVGTFGSAAGAAVPRSDAWPNAIRAVKIGRRPRGEIGDHGRHLRREIEYNDGGAAASDEQCVSIWRHEKPVRGGERVHAIRARRTTLRPGQSTEGAVRAKSGKRIAEVCEERTVPATEPGKSVAGPCEIYTSEASDDGGNPLCLVNRVKLRPPALPEIISRVCHLIASPHIFPCAV